MGRSETFGLPHAIAARFPPGMARGALCLEYSLTAVAHQYVEQQIIDEMFSFAALGALPAACRSRSNATSGNVGRARECAIAKVPARDA